MNTVKLNFGKKAKQPNSGDRERDRRRVSIDWDAIRAARRTRIQWEIDQGLNPPEAVELEEDYEPLPNNPYGNPGNKGPSKRFDREEMVRLYTKENLNGKQVAERLGCDPAVVYRELKERGITREYKGGHNGHTVSVRSS